MKIEAVAMILSLLTPQSLTVASPAGPGVGLERPCRSSLDRLGRNEMDRLSVLVERLFRAEDGTLRSEGGRVLRLNGGRPGGERRWETVSIRRQGLPARPGLAEFQLAIRPDGRIDSQALAPGGAADAAGGFAASRAEQELRFWLYEGGWRETVDPAAGFDFAHGLRLVRR